MNSTRRIVQYLFGLFIMTLGIAFSLKSNLGSTPSSSIPYSMELIWGIEVGLATSIFNVLLVLTEPIILRRKFKKKHLLQIPVSIIFGFFTTIAVNLISFIPDPSNFLWALVMMVVSIFLVALGLFFYVPTNLVPLAGEGVVQSIAIVSKRLFPRIKVFFDSTMVIASFILSYVFLGVIGGSVGIGTIISAIFVGITLKYINKAYTYLTGKDVDLKKM